MGRPKKGAISPKLQFISDKWEEYKTKKNKPVLVCYEENDRRGNTFKYTMQLYYLNEFARDCGYTRFESMVYAVENMPGGSVIIARIRDEWRERLEALTANGSINPMFGARMLGLADKRELSANVELQQPKEITVEQAKELLNNLEDEI